MNSFCGKDCGLCAWREQLDCAGCREGLGKRFDGPCEVAACCREKGHEACATCSYLAGCPRRAGREQIPQGELRRREEERRRQGELAERAPVLGKYLWWMFWLVVPRQLAVFLSMDVLASRFPALDTVGTALGTACGLALAFFLWRLGTVMKGYRTAACLQLAAIAADVLVLCLLNNQEIAALVGLAVIILGLCREYQTYHAHACVLAGVDDGLAEQWRRLWEWTAGLFGGLVLCIFLTAFLGILGLLLLVADALGIVVLAVMEMVYLWRTAKLFRNDQPPAPPEAPGISA